LARERLSHHSTSIALLTIRKHRTPRPGTYHYNKSSAGKSFCKWATLGTRVRTSCSSLISTNRRRVIPILRNCVVHSTRNFQICARSTRFLRSGGRTTTLCRLRCGLPTFTDCPCRSHLPGPTISIQPQR